MSKQKQDLSTEEYLSRMTQKRPDTLPPANLAAFSQGGAFTVSGMAHGLKTRPQADVKNKEALVFDHLSSTFGGNAAQQQGDELCITVQNDCPALIWYTACASPLYGTSASLELELNGLPVSGGFARASSSYQIGVQMSLGAMTFAILRANEAQRLRLLNADATADMTSASLSVLAFLPVPPILETES